MGLADWFNGFCGNLQVQNRGNDLRPLQEHHPQLNTDFWARTSDTAHSLCVGSYGRNTAIHGMSDLDMIMQLPLDIYTRYNGCLGNEQSALLQAVKSSIECTYSTMSIRAAFQDVRDVLEGEKVIEG